MSVNIGLVLCTVEFSTIITRNFPVDFPVNRLANIGLGHGAFDDGVGYTYFDEKTGHEFSAVLGFTGNFENHSTGYTNGIDMHLDWGASQFLTAIASRPCRLCLRAADR